MKIQEDGTKPTLKLTSKRRIDIMVHIIEEVEVEVMEVGLGVGVGKVVAAVAIDGDGVVVGEGEGEVEEVEVEEVVAVDGDGDGGVEGVVGINGVVEDNQNMVKEREEEEVEA